MAENLIAHCYGQQRSQKMKFEKTAPVEFVKLKFASSMPQWKIGLNKECHFYEKQ